MNALFKNVEIKPPRTQAFESASLEINAIVPAPSFTLNPGQGMHFVKRIKKKIEGILLGEKEQKAGEPEEERGGVHLGASGEEPWASGLPGWRYSPARPPLARRRVLGGESGPGSAWPGPRGGAG